MRKIAVVLCLALFVGTIAAAHAAKVNQPPKTGLSYDFASEMNGNWTTAMADDWVCPDGAPITGVRWWGSYWQPPVPGAFTPYSDTLNGAPAGGITSFTIGVFANTPAGGNMPFDHPDTSTLLGGWIVPASSVTETLAFTVTKSTSPSVTENVYEYYLDLTSIPGAGAFQQTQGTKYWLAIGAISNDPTRQWGWHEADGHWGSYATQTAPVGFNPPLGWYIPCGGHDMAFELITVPEPGTLAALGFGVIGLAPLARGIRRRSK